MGHVVITRDAAGGLPYAAALAPLGLDAVMMPVTETRAPDDPGALARALERGGYQAIVCASARAAAAIIDAQGPAPMPEVWAVGPATARVLADLAPILPDGVRDGASLAHALVAARALAGKRVLVPRAQDGRDEAIAILREAGAIVDDIVAYRTVPVRADDARLAAGRAALPDAVACCVFAPSQVAALDALVPIRTLAAVTIAIGATTAVALRAAGAARIVAATSPTPAGIANAVASMYPRKS